MSRSQISSARRVAKRDGWDARAIRTELDAKAVHEGCWFDRAAADHVVGFFAAFLRHSKGEWAGQPFTLLPWQERELIRPLFGWKRANGTRRYRRAYVEIPKKNGKSALASGLSLYLLVSDGEPGAEVYNVACDRDQAAIVFNEALTMVRRSPDLDAVLDPVESQKRIVYPAQAAIYRALSAEASTKEGYNIHGLIVDELHAQRSRELWDTLVYGGAARRQPLMLAITTAGIFGQSVIAWEQHEYARQVLAGVIEDWSFFALVYAAPAEADWRKKTVWRKANPSWGVTVKPEAFDEECREAQASPAKENAFRRYRLNQWVQQATRYISLTLWDENHQHTLDPELLKGRGSRGGLDLASVSDLTAWVQVPWPHPGTGRHVGH